MTSPGAPRVLHLDHTSVAGGAEFALLRMLRSSPPWRPVLLVPQGSEGGVYGDLAGRVPVRTGGVGQRAGVSSGGLLSVMRAAGGLAVQAISTRLDPAFRTADVVDANTARSAAYGALAALTSRVPFIVHLRDLIDPDALGGFGFAVMTRAVLPRADAVIANSRATLESAGPFLRPGAVTVVIPSAAGLAPVEPGSSRAARTDDEQRAPLVIGMMARIDPWKGQHLLLEAFAEAFGDTHRVRLELPGDPLFGHEEHLDSLRARARELGVADRVAFAGHVDPARTLADWDIAVQYSTRPEPLGQNVLQYLAAGCATVVADEGGPAEWVRHGENGLRVAPRDSAALAETLRELVADESLRRRLATAAPATPGLLDDAAVAAAHAEFYRQVLRTAR